LILLSSSVSMIHNTNVREFVQKTEDSDKLLFGMVNGTSNEITFKTYTILLKPLFWKIM